MVNKVTIVLDLDDAKAVKKIDDFKGKAAISGKDAGGSFSNSFSRAMKTNINIGSILSKSLLVAGAGFTAMIAGGIKAASTVENLSTQFSTLLGDTAKAYNQMKQLSEFAASTPFQLEGIAQASKTLLAFGFSQEQSIEKLTMLGDAAAATGNDLKEIALIFGQVKAAGKLTGERFIQLAERGINVGPAIAKSMNIAESEVAKLRTEGKITFEIFDKAFKSLTVGSGLFAGGMEKLSQTTSGLFSTLKDNVFLTFAAFGKELEPITKKILKDITIMVKEIKKEFDFKEITISMLTFSRDINVFLVKPFLYLKDVVGLVFSAMVYTIQETAAQMLNIMVPVLEKLNNIGVKAQTVLTGISPLAGGLLGLVIGDSSKAADDFIGVLKLTKDSANDVAVDMANNFRDKFNSFGDGAELADKATAYLDQLTGVVSQSNMIAATTEKIDPVLDAQELLMKSEFIQNMLAEMDATYKKMAASMAATSKKLAATLNATLVKGISGGIQNIVTNIMKGESAFSNFGKFVMQIMGDMALQMGQVLIGAGIGVESLKALGGAAAIAAGIGLVALGTVMKSMGGGGGATSSTGAAGGTDYMGTAAEPVYTEQIDEEGVKPKTEVNLTVQGNILDRRESGLELVNIINEAIDSDSVVINQVYA